MPKQPPAIRPSKPLGWPQTHPGCHLLPDGTCVLEPDATAVPYPAEPVEGRP